MKVAKRRQRDSANRALRHFREDRVPQLAESQAQDPHRAVRQNGAERQHDQGLVLKRKCIDRMLHEQRHIDGGHFRGSEEEQRHHYPQFEIAAPFRPEMRSKCLQRYELVTPAFA
jgi:predicted DNA-binding transcriptional regulator YafY